MAGLQNILHVNQSGGPFKKIQEAVDAVPDHNNKWIKILVHPGVYTEQVTIPRKKPFVFIEGSGEQNTKVECDGHDTIENGATFKSLADNILVANITFTNTYNFPPDHTKNKMIQAVAVKVFGEKTSFYNVTFLGIQDTLYDAKGKHYFKSRHIEGSVDFICGAGQSFYENCTISVVPKNGVGVITAQRREKATDTNGFVFKDCKIVGTGKTLLGRAWNEFARVFFFNTCMENIIVPAGWDTMVENAKDVTFGEYGCKGPGAKNTANENARAKWETQVTDAMAEKFGNRSYVDDDRWIENQPKIS